jgi:hypothetical protein
MSAFWGFHRIEIVALVGCLGLLGMIFELVRRKKIKERYSMLWFCTGVSVLVLSVKREWLEKFSAMIGVYYAPSSLFIVLSGFMILILIHYSMVISQLLAQNQKLGQKIALLEAELHAFTREHENKEARGQASGFTGKDRRLSAVE